MSRHSSASQRLNSRSGITDVKVGDIRLEPVEALHATIVAPVPGCNFAAGWRGSRLDRLGLGTSGGLD